jgi:hypothetical protein
VSTFVIPIGADGNDFFAKVIDVVFARGGAVGGGLDETGGGFHDDADFWFWLSVHPAATGVIFLITMIRMLHLSQLSMDFFEKS